MDFESFLNQANTPSFWQQKSVVCFQAPTYPFMFFNLLFKKISSLPFPYKRITVDAADHQKILPLIGQSILGTYHSYWLGDFLLHLKEKQQQLFVPQLAAYQGPNQLLFFIDHDLATTYKKQLAPASHVVLKNSLSWSDFQLLLAFFDQKLHPQKQLLIKKIFDQIETLTLDFACMIMRYVELINHKFIDEFFPYFSSLLPQQPSLNLLSESFFSRNGQQFFKTWSLVKEQYSDMFWLAYWSEQLWKAYHVIKLLDQQNFSKAKKISFRLPYSFIQKTWKSFSPEYVAQLHQNLYAIDFMIKKGSMFCSLDLFYFSHFFNKTSHT